ncbi:MAG: DNA mismatch repair endonuclease MutL [Terriglobales bacterium]
MPKVLVLPDHIASQIAAGEVVERPSSVVKELVENALDAGATQIEIAVASNCRDIRVADNGCGMAAEDAALAFHRHATSKIKSADDLWTLKSLGFRGEALPSIASVAHVTCTSRTREAQSGCRVSCADGTAICAETGCAPGTVLEVTDLFYNVPARLNFLKKASTEFAHIQETVQSLAIAHPEVSFHLINQDQTSFKTSGTGELAQAAVECGMLSGREKLCTVDYEDPRHGLRVVGVAARPLHFRGDRKGILSIVNRRPVRCPLTYKALDYAYSDLIPRGRHPFAVVTIEIDADKVDVNIHPTKKEIKYSNGNEVYMTVQRALVNALREEQSLAAHTYAQQSQPAADSPRSYAYDPHYCASSSVGETADERPDERSYVDARRAAERAIEQISFRDQLDYAPPAPRAMPNYDVGSDGSLDDISLPPDWRIAGYIHNTYILIESADGLVVVEQHIAHERTLYERILAAQELPGRICEHSQRLVICAPLQLAPEQRAVLEQHSVVLQRLGFDFDFQPDGTVSCTQVPLELAHKNYASIVQEMVSQLATTDSAELELEATKSIACQAAIKNGMPLGEHEILKLLSDWLRTPRNDTCPHGRPVMLRLTKDRLFQMFHPD